MATFPAPVFTPTPFTHRITLIAFQAISDFPPFPSAKPPKTPAGPFFLFTRVLGIGVRLYLGGVIMVVIWRYFFPHTPISLTTYFFGMLFVTVITTVYTMVGGMKAVVWTELIQPAFIVPSVLLAAGLELYV